MSDDVFAKMATGMAGRFWSLVDGEPKDPDFHGFIRRDDDGYWVVELEGGRSALDDADLEGRFADAMVCVLGGGTVFLSDRQRWRHTPASVGRGLMSSNSGSPRRVTGVDVNNVKADGIVLAESRFPNQRPWAEYEQPDWRHRDASDPLGQGVSLDLPAGAETTLSVGNRMTLTVLPTWWARPEIDQWHIGTGLSLALSSPEPTPSKVYGAARAGASRVWTMGWPFWARHRLRGVRLLASDTDWFAGAGVELRGPIGMLLLLLTGRTAAAMPHLAGPGVHTITERSVVPRAVADQG